MPVELPAQQFLNELCDTDWKAGCVSASLMSALTAATLTAKAAQCAYEQAQSDEDRQQLDVILQASHSRREELAALFSQEREGAANGSLSRLLFEAGVDPSSGEELQKELRGAVGLPLAAIRVQLDGLKILRRLAGYLPENVACEAETAMNLSLAGMSSLRTVVELSLSRMSNRQFASEAQQELRNIAESAEALTNEIVPQVRSKIF